MKKECGKCKGTGKMRKPYKDMCGGRHETQECNVCYGSGRNPDYREKRCEYSGWCGEMLGYHKDTQHPPKYCAHHKQVVQREQQEARQRQERERASRQNQRAVRTDYPHEPQDSENSRFHAACGRNGANLTGPDKNRFRAYYHTLPNRERMTFDEIVREANQWRVNNGGGYRRSDR